VRYAGKTYDGPRISTVVFPRGDDDIVIRAAAIRDQSAFEDSFPQPVPPTITKPNKPPYPDTLDAGYLTALNKWATNRTHWLIIESLKATPEIEWDTVTANPDTWGNYEAELQTAGFSPLEIALITNAVIQANGLDQEKIDEATQRFLASQAEQSKEQLSLHSEPETTLSGEPASG